MPQSPPMDRRLREAILKGEVPAFLTLIQEDEHIIDQTIPGSSSNILHIVSRFGHVELAKEIVRLRPELMFEENEKMETPLHEACREGKMEMVRLLVETDPWLVYKVNQDNGSALTVACERGKLDVVDYLLSFPGLLMLELDGFTTSLHAAASGGHTGKYYTLQALLICNLNPRNKLLYNTCALFRQCLEKKGSKFLFSGHEKTRG